MKSPAKSYKQQPPASDKQRMAGTSASSVSLGPMLDALGWQGNLPCLQAPDSACQLHDPAGNQVFFFDSTLPHKAMSGSVTSVFKSLTGRKGKHRLMSDTNQIQSLLPKSPQTLDPLKPIHPLVPYSLSFYHVHSALNAQRTGGPAASGYILEGLTCRGITGTSLIGPSRVHWSATPRIVRDPGAVPGTEFLFYLQQHIVFSIPLDVGGKGTTYSNSKQGLFSGWRDFHLCSHMRREFTSVSIKQRHEFITARVKFNLTNTHNQTFEGDWESEVGAQPQDICCGYCLTDSRMTLHLSDNKQSVLVNIWTWRDLGNGSGEMEARWISALRGRTNLARQREDFGRIRKEYLGDKPVSQTGLVQPLGKVGESVSTGATRLHVDPPPYTPSGNANDGVMHESSSRSLGK